MDKTGAIKEIRHPFANTQLATRDCAVLQCFSSLSLVQLNLVLRKSRVLIVIFNILCIKRYPLKYVLVRFSSFKVLTAASNPFKFGVSTG